MNKALEMHYEWLHDNAPPPFNDNFRPGFGIAVSREYRAYCESDEAPQDPGPNPIRAAKFREICKRLEKDFPTMKELRSGRSDSQAES